MLGNRSLLPSKLPDSERRQNFNCSSTRGNSSSEMASDVQQTITERAPLARSVILTQDQSTLKKRRASCGACFLVSPLMNVGFEIDPQGMYIHLVVQHLVYCC
ncbi:hypothetical protein ECG_05637 [Echinococcus granulosus]|nr:hypothetical protein ECG_05637 [Echinococcus granulosus]